MPATSALSGSTRLDALVRWLELADGALGDAQSEAQHELRYHLRCALVAALRAQAEELGRPDS